MSNAVRVVLILAAVVTASGAAPAAQTPAQLHAALSQGASRNWLGMWLEAVRVHRPGEADAPASVIATLTADDLELLLPALVHYLNYGRMNMLPNQPSGQPDPSPERRRLLRETQSRAPSPESLRDFPLPNRLNDLIIRGVMLHSDAATRFPPARTVRRTTAAYNVLQLPPEVVRSGDGQFVGTTMAVGHWYLARALLHFMMPEPALTPFTKQWYHAATTYFAANSDFAGLAPHFVAAEALFPDDATLAFDMGWQSETAATPRVQHDLRALIAQALGDWKKYPFAQITAKTCDLVPCDKDKNPFGIKSERKGLADAERRFSQAIKLDATMTEAYVRLANVRTLMGRAADALPLFRKLPPSGDARIRFYAAIVEGKTLEALGRLDDATASYQRGHDLFPDASSVNIALSAVEQRRGDAPRAVSFARRAVDSPAGAGPPIDPLESYFYGRGRDLEATWAALIAALEASR